jgi:hypothetical protein
MINKFCPLQRFISNFPNLFVPLSIFFLFRVTWSYYYPEVLGISLLDTGRVGNDSNIGEFTCRNASAVDYFICSPNFIKCIDYPNF